MAEKVGLGILLSSDTWREDGPIPTLADELRRLDSENALLAQVEDWENDRLAEDMVPDLVDALVNALNELAPPYCYFGASSDGDFGWWVDWDAIEEAKQDGYVYATEEPPEFILHFNDHGNATLYRVNVEEVWSVV